MPPNKAITEAAVAEGLEALQNEGLVGNNGDLSSTLTSFAPRAFPIAGFFGLKILTINADAAEKTQLALFRGISTLLLAQMTEENGREKALLSSISTSQLPELLFNLSTRPFEVTSLPPRQMPQPAAPGTIACGKCGTQNNVKSKFCSKCGAALAAAAQAGPKFCPKCGDPVTAGEKFCDKCGTALK